MNLRTIPPAAAPVTFRDLVHGFLGIAGKAAEVKLERELREYFRVENVFLVSSGKAALLLILSSLKRLSGKKKVIIPAYTCFSVPSAVRLAGLDIVLCDVKPETLDFDYSRLDALLDEETLCVIPTHLFGIPSDIEKIRTLCIDRGIWVVEDAAQAMGGKDGEKLLGLIGDVGFFSLGRGKNITCGSGGIIVTDSDIIANAIEKEYALLQDYRLAEVIKEFVKSVILSIFIHPSLYWLPAGLPFLKLGETVFYKDFPVKKLSGMHAGLMWNFQKRLESSNDIRKINSAWFKNKLRSPQVHGASLPFLRLPLAVRNREIRDRIAALSQEKGLGISRMYPTPVNEIAEIRDHFVGMVFPVAHKIAECLLTLPTHHLLSKKDKEKICRYLDGRDEAFSLKRSVVEG